MELYYAIVNILDWYAKEDGKLSDEYKSYLEDIIYKLCEIGDFKIEDIGDANDCPDCKDVDDLILGFIKLWETEQRR